MSHEEHRFENVRVEKSENSEVTITAEIPAQHLDHYRAKAIAKLSEDVTIDGFRKGHIPEDVLIKHVGEAEILRELASTAIQEQYPHLMHEVAEEHQLPIIGTPNVSISKLAPGNPIEFSVQAALMPDVTLPDYKKIAAKHTKDTKEIEVTEEEVQETITHLRRERAKIDLIEKGTDAQQAAQEAQQMDTLALPGIDDAFVQTLGFENVDAFTERLRENIKNEKGLREREKTRIGIIEDIIKESAIPLPNLLVEHELDGMEQQFTQDLAQAGTTLDAYLGQATKTRETLRDEWREGAAKRAKMHLVLREIAQKENISAPKEEVDTYVEQVTAQHKEANPDAVRSYYELNLRNEAVFRFLEEQK